MDNNASDSIGEELIRAGVHASRIAMKSPTAYEARSDLMCTTTGALSMLGCGFFQPLSLRIF